MPLDLVARLNQGLTRRRASSSSSAPQQAIGKSTLVSEWLQQLSTPSAWLTLDEGVRLENLVCNKKHADAKVAPILWSLEQR